MEEIYERCCGLDVHRDTIVACIMIGNGASKRKQIRTFSTYTEDLIVLRDWLKEQSIRQVAMESTGIYWTPIFDLLEHDFDLWLVNARHVKNVPGRKTDVKDSEWLCRLLKSGLLSKSFVPPKEFRRLRKLIRYRQSLQQDLVRVKNRVIKILEASNIKLSRVFSDVFGLTSWTIIKKLVAGISDLEQLTSFIDRRCRASKEEIQKALRGTLDEHDRIMLRLMIQQVNALNLLTEEAEEQIKRNMAPFEEQASLLETIPGISSISAASIIAEIGIDMEQFKSAGHLTAWAGICPGNNTSGGKTLSTRIRKGNSHLKVVLVQAGWAASKTKKSFLGAKYRSLALRKSKKKAVVAIGRKLLVIIYHMLKDKRTYHELGADFLDSLEPERKAKYHEKRLEELGYYVTAVKRIA